jgi:hypothetical protein
MKRPALHLVPLLAATLLSTGCATIFLGPNDGLKVVTDPPGATARVGGASVVTPGVLRIPRGKEPVVVRVEKEGFEPREVTVTWTRSGLVGMNALGVGLGAGATLVSGVCLNLMGGGCSNETTLTPLLVGAAVTAAGLALDLPSSKKYSLERDDLVLRLEPVRLAEAPKGALR